MTDFTYPYFICYKVTHKCVANCEYCLDNFTEHDLSTSEAEKVINAIVKAGTKSLSFGGREPFLRSDIFDLIKYAKECGLFVSVETTGLTLNLEDLKKLSDLGLDSLVISIDSIDKNICKEIGRAYLFDNKFETIKTANKECQWQLTVVTVVTKVSVHGLLDIGEALDGMDLNHWSLRQFIPRGYGSEVKEKYQISDEEFYIASRNLIAKYPKLNIKYYSADAFEGTFIMISPSGNIIQGLGEGYKNLGNVITDGANIKENWQKYILPKIVS